MTGLLLFASFAILLILGVPICVSLGLSSVVGLLACGFDLGMLPDTLYASICKYALLAVPFFVLAGAIMEYAGISEKLIRFADTCVGHRKSGLITVVVITSCFFAAISGSGAAAVAALGGIYDGIFTPTEAAAVAVIYGLFVGIFIYRKITLKNILSVLRSAAVSSATVMYVVACASIFAWVLTTSHVATDISNAMLALSSNKIVLLLLTFIPALSVGILHLAG